jgi:NitT/TauT family transport system substrate-binding protein
MEVPLMQNALISGDVDGYIAWEPYVTQAKIDGRGRILMNSNNIWPDIPTCVVISTNKFMTQKPDQLKKFLKVHVEATDYVNTHEDETAVIVSKKLGTNVNIEHEARNNIKFIAIPTTEFQNNLMKLVEIQKQVGYIKGNNTDNINSFTDLSFLP